MSVLVHPVDKPDLAPLRLSDRFRHEVCYFMTPAGSPGVPPLGAAEYWVPAAAAREFLDDGVVRIVSPLDSSCKTEIELSEEQERWLEWMVRQEVEHIRLVSE